MFSYPRLKDSLEGMKAVIGLCSNRFCFQLDAEIPTPSCKSGRRISNSLCDDEDVIFRPLIVLKMNTAAVEPMQQFDKT